MSSSGCTKQMPGQVKMDLAEITSEALQVCAIISASPLKLNKIGVLEDGAFSSSFTSSKLLWSCPSGVGDSKRLAPERHTTALWSQMQMVAILVRTALSKENSPSIWWSLDLPPSPWLYISPWLFLLPLHPWSSQTQPTRSDSR